MTVTLRAAILAALAASVPTLARAADVTPEQARTLEGQLRDWFASMAGPGLPVAASPIKVAPEGDHYRLTGPSADAVPVKGWPSVVANARPAGDGRWTLDGIKVQTPATFTVDAPTPAAKPGEKPGPAVPTTYTMNYATQDGGGTWDTTYKTASEIKTNSTGFRLTSEGGGAQGVTAVESMANTLTIRPAADNRVDIAMDAGGTGYTMQNKPAGAAAPAMDVSARQVKVGFALPGVSREQSAKIIPAIVRMAPAPGAAPAAGAAPGSKPPPNPEGVRMLVQAMRGLASGMTLTEVLDDLKVKGEGFNFTSSQVRFAMNAKSDGALMNGNMEIGLDNMALPGMGLEMFADLFPKRIAVRPILSNVPSKELFDALQAAADKPDQDPSGAMVAALFSRGPIKTGLESFALDIGGASFTGKADVTMPSPSAASGTAQIVATNIDTLLTKVQANPALAQAVPVIVLAKGIGRAEGSKMTWDISFDNGRVVVNGVDLNKMGGK